MKAPLFTLLVGLLAGSGLSPLSVATEPEPRDAYPDAVKEVANPLALPELASLDAARLRYRSLADRDAWPQMRAGPLLRLGDRHPDVLTLRTLLQHSQDLTASENSGWQLFDLRLHDALVRYQVRHGLKGDGIVGPKTRAELNVSPLLRLEQLEVNALRQRAFYRRAELRYVQVNLPDYRLRLVEDGVAVAEMKAIIGRRSRHTPELSSAIHSLVINPSWNVPQSIAEQDILPHWQSDPGYLARYNYRVVSGWSLPRQEVSLDQLEQAQFYRGKEYLRLWQPPGQDNALGQLKFEFANEHDIYLHDTPHRRLFERRLRALSSGCVRVEKPQLLARLLLDGERETGAFEAFLQAGETRYLRLSAPVPIHLTYWTAWVDDGGVVQFRPDIYERDRIDLARLRESLHVAQN